LIVIVSSWSDGWRRVAAAPALAAGVLAATLLLAAPLTVAMDEALRTHLGRSLAAEQAAEGVNYDWWQEFTAQSSGLSRSFVPAIVGFAATLDNISSVADGQAESATLSAALVLYIAAWVFLSGGIVDRYARQRPLRAFGFFAACGVYFVRFLRLALFAALFYWWAFGFVHPWLFDEWYQDVIRDISVERNVFVLRVSLYAAFGAVVVLGNVLFDYAKIRAVVEDRRSMAGALTAAARFMVLHPARVFGLYAVNSVMFVALLAVWALAAPGAGGSGAAMWAGLAAGQLYLIARLILKLHFIASQTAMFQASLAHATYTAAPDPVWPESAAAETIRA
jgi:hypothetical protein